MATATTTAKRTRAKAAQAKMAAGELLFTAFVNGLTERKTRHAFLRGMDVYPSVREGSDVDMLVHPRDLAGAEAAFRAAAKSTGFHIWQRFRSGFITRIFAYAFDQEKGHVFFDLDIHTSEASYGTPYFTASELLPLVVVENGLSQLPPKVAAMVNALGALFMGGAIPEKYRAAWAAAGTDDVSAKLLASVVGVADSAAILGSLESGDTAKALADGHGIGARARRRMLRAHPVRSALGFCAFGYGERIAPWFSPRGRFLIFAGTDGSGKTTLVRELIAQIGPRFREGPVEEHHLRPGVIPQISSLFHGGKPAYSIEDMDDPHRSTPSGFVGSSLRTVYYWVDYLIGYPLRILPKRRRNALIIYDRWFFDHVVDPRRFRIQQGHPLPGFLVRFLAKPDRLIVCAAEPETILSRKQELAPEEVARQVVEFRKFAAKNPRATLIDTTNEIQDCVDKIIRSIFEGAAA